MSNTQTESRAGYIKAMFRPNAFSATWACRPTEYEAVTDLLMSAYYDWKSQFDLKAAAREVGMEIELYRDAGTDKHSDDQFIKTITVFGDYIEYGKRNQEETAFITTSVEVLPCES